MVTGSRGIGSARFAGEKDFALGMQGHRQFPSVTVQSVVHPSGGYKPTYRV
jgi:hypothetical protein